MKVRKRATTAGHRRKGRARGRRRRGMTEEEERAMKEKKNISRKWAENTYGNG